MVLYEHMSTQCQDIIGQAYRLAKSPDRDQKMSDARDLAAAISGALWNGCHNVEGEAGLPNWIEATRQLVEPRKINPIRAWMLAELVATGVSSAHELANVQPISDERLYDLTLTLATGTLAMSDECYVSA